MHSLGPLVSLSPIRMVAHGLAFASALTQLDWSLPILPATNQPTHCAVSFGGTKLVCATGVCVGARLPSGFMRMRCCRQLSWPAGALGVRQGGPWRRVPAAAQAAAPCLTFAGHFSLISVNDFHSSTLHSVRTRHHILGVVILLKHMVHYAAQRDTHNVRGRLYCTTCTA